MHFRSQFEAPYVIRSGLIFRERTENASVNMKFTRALMHTATLHMIEIYACIHFVWPTLFLLPSVLVAVAHVECYSVENELSVCSHVSFPSNISRKPAATEYEQLKCASDVYTHETVVHCTIKNALISGYLNIIRCLISSCVLCVYGVLLLLLLLVSCLQFVDGSSI